MTRRRARLSLALAAETRGSAVTVLAHCPGPTETEFHLVVGLETKLAHLPSAGAAEVVARAVSAAERGKSVLIDGRLNTVLAQLNRVFPRRAAALLVERILRAKAARTKRPAR